MSAAAPLLTFIPDLVESHFDELQFLWTQRRRGLRSPSYVARQLSALEERIEGHLEGLLVIGERLPEFVAPALAGDEEMPAFAAAFALLRYGAAEGLEQVADALGRAAGKKVDGLRDALAHGPSTPLAARLASVARSASPQPAAAAAEALAFHGIAAPTAADIESLARADDAAVRAAAWRLAAYCGVSVPTQWYERAVQDEELVVKRAAVTAAAWNGVPTFSAYCRALAAKPSPESVEFLASFASIAQPEEYQLIGAVATNKAAGPRRFDVVGAFGHPYFIELLIKEMENGDAAVAVAAAAAFGRMTGRDVDSDRRAKVSPDGKPPADDFEAEFQDEVSLPDPELARKHWRELAPTLARAPRICRGMDVSQPLSREQFAALDMESRWEYCLRMRLFSGWQGTPLVLERYPQRF